MKRAILLFSFLAPLAVGQFYNMSTVAGIGRPHFVGGPALNSVLIQPLGIAVDSSDNIYVSDGYYNQVLKITPGGTVSVYAGNGTPGFSGDGGPATSAQLFNPADIAVDGAGNLFIADLSNARIRKVTPAGIISTVAGSGTGGVTGDGGSATAAGLGGPHGIAVDAAGALYISQPEQQVIRMVSPTGTISTFAGTGESGFSGDGGPATKAKLSHPQGLRVDKNGSVLFADTYNYRIRKITAQGIITTFAGNGDGTFFGDGFPATNASLFYPTDIAIDSIGAVYIADATNIRIRRVGPEGFIQTVAGGGGSIRDGPALQAYLAVTTSIALDSKGNIVIPLTYLRQVRRVTQGNIATIVGAPAGPAAGDGGPASEAPLLDPFGIAADSAGNLYVADQSDNRIRKISSQRFISTYAGNGVFGSAGDGSTANTAQIGDPRAAGLDPAGNLYVTSPISAVTRRITPGGIISTFAGGAGIGFTGDGMQARIATFNVPLGVVGDALGNVYISDAGNARIRKIDSSGIVSTFAGNGVEGFSGDGGEARLAKIYQPRQMAVDANNNIFFADSNNHRVRKIDTRGIISTVAGNGNAGFSGDGGPATAAQLANPTGLALDAAGNIYIATGLRVRKVDASSGTISTIAGTGVDGFSGDGALATLGTFSLALYLAVDSSGNVFVTDQANQRVRQLTPVQIVKEAVANAATFAAGGVAPGEIVTIFGGPGISLGPAAGVGLALDASGKVATQLGGVQALFDGVAAPLTFVNGGQINAVVPYSVAGKATTELKVMVQGKPTNTVTLPVVASSPGVFAITNSDGTVNSAGNPSAANGVLVIYATGEGKGSPEVADGTVNANVFPKPLLPVTVQIGGQTAAVLYAGAAPGFVAGVLQVNVQISAGLNGSVPLKLLIGDNSTPAGLTISVRGQ